MTLVADADSLLAVLKRLHALNDGVLFWNEQRSFKLMLRNDPMDADTVACELAMVYDDEDESFQRIIELANDGYLDEPGTFVFDSWSFPAADLCAADVAKVMHAVNRAYLYRVCPCGKYLIKDDAPLCVYCQLVSTPADRDTHFCSICCEDGISMHMQRQPCCRQHLHSHCLATWRAKSRNDACPLCRG